MQSLPFDQNEKTQDQPKALFLYAKESLCFCAKSTDNSLSPVRCHWEENYFDHQQDAMAALLEQSVIHHESICSVAERFQICPHQLVKDMIPWVDVIAADFNYVFDLGIRNNEFFQQHGKHICLLVDEAHNLPDRARAMYSLEFSSDLLVGVRQHVSQNLDNSKQHPPSEMSPNHGN